MGGSEIRKKQVFTLSTGDKCNNYNKQLQISKNKNVYHFYTFDKKNFSSTVFERKHLN